MWYSLDLVKASVSEESERYFPKANVEQQGRMNSPVSVVSQSSRMKTFDSTPMLSVCARKRHTHSFCDGRHFDAAVNVRMYRTPSSQLRKKSNSKYILVHENLYELQFFFYYQTYFLK